MSVVVITIAPVFLLIGLGFGLRRSGWPGEELWRPAEQLTYFVLFPALLLRTLATANFSGLAGARSIAGLQGTSVGGVPVGDIALVLVIAVAAMTLIVLVVSPILRNDGRALTSLLQGSIRFNTYLGFAVLAAFYGERGLTLGAVYLAIMVPLVNVVSVVALAVVGSVFGGPWWRAPLEIVRNPLIVACVLGIAINVAGLPVPSWIDGFLEILARAALPLGLLCVGAGLDLVALDRGRANIATACVLKLIAMPALTWGACQLVGLGGVTASVLIVFNALPAAPSAYILARQMGGDAWLMAGILTAQLAAAIVTLPLLVTWLG